jgi:hypothetical protein
MISYLLNILSFWSCALASKTYKYLPIYLGRYLHNKNSHPDGWSRIGNFLLWWTRVRTIAVKLPDGGIWIAILALRRRASGRLIDLPFLGTWKEIWNWSSTERRPDVLLKRPNGCKLDRTFSTQWRVQTERHVVRTDGTVDRWASGRDGSIVRAADRELEILLTCRQNRLTSLWIVESLFTASLHISNFVQTQNEAKILTNRTFDHSGTKIT